MPITISYMFILFHIVLLFLFYYVIHSALVLHKHLQSLIQFIDFSLFTSNQVSFYMLVECCFSWKYVTLWR